MGLDDVLFLLCHELVNYNYYLKEIENSLKAFLSPVAKEILAFL